MRAADCASKDRGGLSKESALVSTHKGACPVLNGGERIRGGRIRRRETACDHPVDNRVTLRLCFSFSSSSTWYTPRGFPPKSPVGRNGMSSAMREVSSFGT